MKISKIASLLFLQLTLSYGALPSNSTLNNGLVAHYPLDGNVRDIIALNDGVKYGSTPIGSRFATFNGTDDYIELAKANKFITNKPKFSISYWIRVKRPSNRQPSTRVSSFLSKRDQCGLESAFDMRGSSTINFENLDPNDHKAIRGRLHQDGWELITLVKTTGVGGRSIYKLYNHFGLASRLVFNYSDSILKKGDLSLSNSPCIHSMDGTERFKGDIDDVRIYDRALSSDEVAVLQATTHPDYQTAKEYNTPYLFTETRGPVGNNNPASRKESDLYGEILISGEPIEYDLEDEE
jgi:hypothetical protein